MKRVYLFLNILIAVIIFSTTEKTLSQNSYKRVFTVQDGLAQSQVFSLCQDKKGNIWVGTVGGGISIYNGVGFKNISKDEGLAGNTVYSIIQDKAGNIWAGTDKGLSKISGKIITNYSTKEGLPDNTVWKVFEDHTGTIWIGTSKGLASFNKNKITAFNLSKEISQSIIYSLFEDIHFNLWVGTKESGVYKIIGNKTINYSKNNGLSDNTIWTINQDAQNNVVLGTNYGINLILKDTILITRPSDSFTGSVINKEKNILFCTYKGWALKYLNNNNNKLTYSQIFNLSYGFPIRAIIEDFENNIWAGTENGLVLIPPTPFRNWNSSIGLQNNNVFSIFKGYQKEELWIGCFGRGVSNYSKTEITGKFNYFITFRDDITLKDPKILKKRTKQQILKVVKKGLIGSKVLSIIKDNKNRTWFGTWNGISIFNLADSSFIHITNDTADKKFIGVTINNKLTNKSFNCLTMDNTGKIWGGTMAGIVVFSDTTIIENNAELNKLNKISVYNIFQDKNNSYWISTQEGLFVYNGITLRHFTEKDNFIISQISSVTQDYKNTYWISSKEGIYNYNGKVFVKIDKQKGLISNNVYLLIIDKTGDYLFIGTNQGLDRLNLKTYHSTHKIEIKHYGKLEGFMGLECNRNACYLDSLGRIWFGTVDGITMYDAEKDVTNTIKPATYITSILYNFKDFDWTSYCTGFDSLTGLPVNLELPYNMNNLRFIFSANSLTSPEKVKYQFMMEGIDNNWSPPMSKNDADFPTLPPGKYTFKVKACNNDGIWNEIPTTFSFVIKPPFYLTWWFITIVIIIGIVLIFAFIKYREAALRRDKLRLEKTVKERTSEVVHQKEIVEQKNKDITDSINYAKNIQEALLPTKAEIGKHFPESFILYKPRDIVSGDFYWISHRGNRTYYAIADCTGHGVPGAFMSMLGIAFLDEVIGMNPSISSNELLNQLRENVILSLRQTGQEGQSKDGMDITLIIADWDKKELEYSGANNPLYLVRNSYLTEYKADKMPIGVHIKKDPFSIHHIPFSLGDSIYLFSDGYADQFGGPSGKKFKYKSLKELLVKISNQPMAEQGIILNQSIEEWKGNMPQLDDIIISGIHFGQITLNL